MTVAAGAARQTLSTQTATLAAVILGSSMAFIDGSVVNVALPTLQSALDASAAGAQWVVNAYLLPLASLVLLGGAAGDRWGRRRAFAVGLTVFALGSILCAAAPGLAVLLAGRVVQGIGATALVPTSLALIGATFDGPARGRAIGTWAATGALCGAAGPVLGGWLIEAVGWRAIFLLNLPLAAAALWLTRAAAETRDPAGRTLDLPGCLFATLGLALLTWSLTALGGRPTAWAWAGLAASGALFTLFVVAERRAGPNAMMPLSLFATRGFVGATVLTLLLYGALGGLLVLLPYALIRVGHASPVQAGAALLPVPLLIGFGSRAAGGLAARIGPRLPLTLGPVVVGIGFALLARAGVAMDYWRTVFPGLTVMAVGMTVSVAPLTTAVMDAVGADRAGIASGVNNAAARVAGLVGTACLGFVLADADPADFMAGFRSAALTGATLCMVAGATAWWLLPTPPRRRS